MDTCQLCNGFVGADLSLHGSVGTLYSGYHYDLNLLTIHGKSRFPGLFVWLRDGRRIPVRIPEGCLFIQAGKQLEWLTGGHVQAGMHEVPSTWTQSGLLPCSARKLLLLGDRWSQPCLMGPPPPPPPGR